MTHIKSRKHPVRSAHAHLAATALSAGLALTLPLAAQAADDDADADKARKPDATTLDKVEVRGLRSFVVSPKFTQTLQDTPQTIQVIGNELLLQQGATTLTEALRNSPGVGTFYAGENGNTSTGDTLYMRGFDTSSSIFVDGARDLGSVSRDLFNIEQVEVVKGPASTDTGRSSPTGAINMVSKQAQLRAIAGGSVSAGTDGQKRATADWNAKLSDSSALRLNAMWQDSDVPGRDHVNNSRWGIAPSLGFGLDGDTRLWLDLLYVKQDNVPDGFVPTIGLPYWEPQPGLEQLAGRPVDPSNFYGTRDDHDDVTSRMATLRLEHDLNDAVKLSNTLRWGETEQHYLLTAFMSTGGSTANPMGGNIKWTDAGDFSTYTLARSLPTFKDNENRILTNQFNLRADFGTGAVDHFLSAGAELTREEQTAHNISVTGAHAPASLYDPGWNDAGSVSWERNGSRSQGRTDTRAVYLFDTMKFGEQFLLTAGLRADRYTTDYFASAVCNTAGTGAPARRVVYCGAAPVGSIVTTADLRDSDTLLSWKIGAVYKPVEALSLYANAALAQQPPGGANFQLAAGGTSANGIDADPQVARTLEVGSKWALNPALSLNLALFRTTVSNEINTQDVPATQTGRKVVEGVEASMVGNITDNWNVSLGYLHQSAEVDKGSLVAADGTPNLTYTPSDAFTSWTTYKLANGLSFGGGVRYTGGLHRGTDGAKGTPSRTKSWTVYDAVVSYAVSDALTLRLNAYNLFDKAYVASINKSGYRYTPGAPRTFLLSADFRF